MPNADTRVEIPRDRRIAIPQGERQYHIGLGPGDLVPSVRDLAQKLRVNPNTVARAYREPWVHPDPTTV